MDIVISLECQKIYNQVFLLLLQIKWAKYSLDVLLFGGKICFQQINYTLILALFPERLVVLGHFLCIHRYQNDINIWHCIIVLQIIRINFLESVQLI